MKSLRSASRVVFATISTLAVVSGTWMIGCGPSGVGTAPSSKEQVAEIYSKENGSRQLKNPPKVGGKNVPGPQSIKSKLFKPGESPPAP
jgi:hypothetical protein